MTPVFTDMQQKCIDKRNCSILVSAGAGSGKTAVLTQRIVQRLTDPNDDFEAGDFIAVTYTKASAAELKSRLYKNLSEYISANPHNKKALRQLAAIQNAKVSTMHSFCLDLISRNFTKLSLSPDMHIGDENENTLILTRLLDDILEDLYDSADTKENAFAEFADTFAGAKTDSGMAQTILKLYVKLRKNPSIEKCFDLAVEKYDEIINNTEFFDSFYGQTARNCLKESLEQALEDMKKLCDQTRQYPETYEGYLPAFEQDLESIKNVISQVDLGYYHAASALLAVSKSPVKRLMKFPYPEFSKQLRDERAAIIDNLLSLGNRFFLATKEQINAAALATKRLTLCMKSIVLRLDEAFTQYKQSRLMLDFNDLEKYALMLLYDIDSNGNLIPSAISAEISQSVKEIYIDEYQDINPIQDLIFCAITQKGPFGEQNRFMVGDKKQSIYRFRGSEPKIFNDYCNTFFDVDSNKKQIKLFLSDNFRCCENVIDTVNFLFESIMADSYAVQERLVHARQENGYTPPPCELLITQPCDLKIDDNTFESSDSIEAEAYTIAKRINEIVNNPMYTNQNGEMFTYGDITILLRSMKGTGDVFEKVLEKCGVPAKSERPECFFEKREIILAVSLLEAIDNPERDIALAAVLKSPIYAFEPDSLVQIKATAKKQSLYTSLCLYLENGSDHSLKQKVGDFLNQLHDFSNAARSLPCDKLIKYVYSKTNLLQICSSRAFGCKTSSKSRQIYSSLMKLYSLAVGFKGNSYKGLFAFIDYIGDLKRQEVSYPEQRKEKSSCVKIMSIHHSKGLEFPVCIVACLSKKFNTDDEKQFLIYDDIGGIACKLKDTQNGLCSIDTPFRQALVELDKQALLEEEKRILYVALTRAKDMLIMSASSKDCQKLLYGCSKSKNKTKTADSPIKWILNALSDSVVLSDLYGTYALDKQASNTAITSKTLVAKLVESAFSMKYAPAVCISDTIETDSAELFSSDQIEKALNFEYKKRSLSKIPSKLTVSELKIGLLDQSSDDTRDFSQDQEKHVSMPPKPKFLSGSYTPSAAEKGTAMHLFMQFADYTNASTASCQSEARNLLNKGFISLEQYNMLDFEPLEFFFKGPLYKKIADSRFVKREMRFNLQIPCSEITSDIQNQNEFVLVQGVIDCFFENPDGTLSVVDFKTDRVSGVNAENILISRHGTQLKYYCRAASKMTAKPVKSAILYSFALNKEVFVEFDG